MRTENVFEKESVKHKLREQFYGNLCDYIVLSPLTQSVEEQVRIQTCAETAHRLEKNVGAAAKWMMRLKLAGRQES